MLKKQSRAQWLKANMVPLTASVLMHAFLLWVVISGLTFQERKQAIKAKPKVMQAQLVVIHRGKDQQKPEEKKAKPRPKPKPEPEEKPKEPPKPVEKPKEKPKPPEPPKPVEKPKEKPKPKEEPKEAPKPVAKPKPKPDKVLERKKQEDAIMAAIQAEQELEMAAALAQEEALLNESTDASDEIAAYGQAVQRAITRKWSRPPSARNGMRAELVINLLPTGDVVGVEVAKGSGNAAFDRAAELAVWKAERFPELQELPYDQFEKYFRRFRLIFTPEDLRR